MEMKQSNQYSILFVCLGNICRSPTAEAVFRRLIESEGLSEQFYLDSAGTSAHHVDESPDSRAIKYARLRNYDLSYIRSRQVCANDFAVFDLILAMDSSNYNDLKRLSLEAENQQKLATIKRLLDFSEQQGASEKQKMDDVPDPYYGGDKGFDKVIDLIEDASRGLLKHIKQMV
jgi:protein-tyrosine phosphatase